MKSFITLGLRLALLCALVFWATPAVWAQNTNSFELKDGDRVVMIGDTLIEREQVYGDLEYLLTTHWPDRHVTFRNIGWSADTPAGISRAGFDPATKGFDRLKEMIAATKPTVVFIGYGMASSFEGEAGLSNFNSELQRLTRTIEEIAGKDVRFVFFSPLRHEKMPPPLPDPKSHNAQIGLYANAIKDFAKQNNSWYISLYDALNSEAFSNPPYQLTDNGIHLTRYGYRRLAEEVCRALKWDPHIWRFGITRDGKVRNGSYGIKVLEHEKRDDYARIVTVDEQLVPPPWLPNEKPQPLLAMEARIQVAGMTPGPYELRIDGQTITNVTQEANGGSGHILYSGPQFEQAEELRKTVLRKNELFFHRWRPQNNTYLFLFRKHEQGQNAKEIPQFDPLIEAEEQKIAKLRKPVKHTFELVAVTENSKPAAKEVADTAPVGKFPNKRMPLPDLKIAPGYEITLFAENPDLAKPIQMNFDPQGRLWVASSSVYPQIEPGQVADDKILILEDTNDDGKADKSTVFADGLLIPTGVEPGDGGAYVGQSTDLLFLKDTDGDGKADHKHYVLSGLGTEDTHHIVHTLRWGHDGQLYFNQSIYIHSHMETPHGVVRLNSGGILNLQPQTLKLGIFMKGLVNSWGHHFDKYGQSFATDGAGGAPPNGIFYVVPGGMYAAYAGARRTLGSISPGSYPKFCGLETIYSDLFPEDWQGNFVTCDFRAHRVVRFAVEENQSAYTTKEIYTSQETPAFVWTKDVTFRPIDVKVGPDGAIYIADWSNPIIQHGEVDFRDPRRDHEHGRIWRVVPKGSNTKARPQLVNASTPDLLKNLMSPNGYTRQHSRRLLTQRGAAITQDLTRWTSSQQSELAKLEGLWMFQAINEPNLPLLNDLLRAQDGRIRAAAVRALTYWLPHEKSALELAGKAIRDEHPRVRLEALRALAAIGTLEASDLALSVLNKPMDPFLDYTLWLTINDLASPWVAGVQSGKWRVEGRERELEFALKSIEPQLASSVLTKYLATTGIKKDGSGAAIELIGQAGGPRELRQLFDRLLEGMDESAALRAFKALSDAVRLRNAKPSGELQAIATTEFPTEKLQVAAIKLAGAWKTPGFTSKAAALAGDKSRSAALRSAAFGALKEIGNKEATKALLSLADSQPDPFAQRESIVALVSADLGQAAPRFAALLTNNIPEDEALSLWREVLKVKGAGAAIARALPKAGLPESSAKTGLRIAREGGRTEPELVIALARSSGLNEELQNLTDAEIKQIASQAKNGDAARGELVYRRKELSCVVCHSIGGAGGKVGPDMTSLGASAPIDYIVESLLAPNKKVKEGYHSIQVVTKDGEELSGILVRENNEEMILRDTTNKEISIPKKNIESSKIGGSLMPVGLVETLSEGDRNDLVKFLSELGKPGPYDASKANVARVWKLNVNPNGSGEELVKSDAHGKDWQPAYTTVNGGILKRELESEFSLNGRKEVFYAATRFQSAKAGPVLLKLQGLNSPKAWVNGKPIGGQSEMRADLPAGIHTFVVKIDPASLPEQLRLEAENASFLVE